MSPILDAANALATDANGLTALHRCTTAVEAEALLKFGLNVNAKSVSGSTPLHFACRGGHFKAAEALIAAGADLIAKTSTGSTPLHSASSGGLLKVARAMIAAGADVNAKTSTGSTPLHSACKNGNLKIAEALIEAGADVNAKNSAGWTPLHFACFNGHLKIAEALFAAGADVNAKTGGGETPLDFCKTDEMKALFTPDTAKITPPAIAPARTVSVDDIRSFDDMLMKAGVMMSAAKIQGLDGQDLVRATSLYEIALGFVKETIKNLTTN